MCDIWRSNIHREYLNGASDNVRDINRRSDDVFVYHSVYKKKKDSNTQMKNDDIDTTVKPVFQTFVIKFEKIARDAPQLYEGQITNEFMGYPILVTFDLNISITIKEIRDRIWELIKPFIPNFNINNYSNKNNSIHNQKPFVMEAQYGFRGVTELTDSDEIFDLSQRNMNFVIHFNDPERYHNDGYKYSNRIRDLSAPHGDRKTYKSTSCIDLEECIYIGQGSKLLKYNLWYCKKCKHFQCIKTKIDSWNSPDLLIIHLDRFDNGLYLKKENYNDMLIKFEIDQELLVPSDNQDTLYDLYAIKNYDKKSRVAQKV